MLCLFVEEADGNEETLSTRTRANSSCTPLDTTESSRRSEESFLLCWCFGGVIVAMLLRCKFAVYFFRSVLLKGDCSFPSFTSFARATRKLRIPKLYSCGGVVGFRFFCFCSLELDTPVGALSTLVAMGWSIFSGQYEAPHRHIAQLFVQCSSSTKDDRCGSVRFDRMVIIRLKRRC